MIRIHIERLILDGVDIPHGEHRTLEADLGQELQRLLSQESLPRTLHQGGAVPSVDGAPLQPGKSPLGRRIARSVYGGLKKP